MSAIDLSYQPASFYLDGEDYKDSFGDEEIEEEEKEDEPDEDGDEEEDDSDSVDDSE